MKTGAAVGTGLGAAAGGVFGGPGGALVGAGLGGALGGLFDSDDPQQAAPVLLNPDDYVLSGAGVDTMRGLGASTSGRAAPTTNYTQADADYERSLAARGIQMGEVARLRGVLDGTGPTTEAQLQLQAGQRDAASLGQQMAASARGTGALLMQRQALNAGVVGAARANEAAAMLRAREIDAAGSQMQGLAGGMRSQDMGSRQESAGQSQFLTDAQLRSRAQNDQASLGYYGLASDEAQAQLDAQMRIDQGNQNAQNGMAAGNTQARSDADQRQRQGEAGLFGGLMSAGVGAMGASKPKPQQQPTPDGGYGPNPYTYGGGSPGGAPQGSGQPQQASFIYDPWKHSAATGGGMSGGNGGLY